jgi:hypothetical protein
MEIAETSQEKAGQFYENVLGLSGATNRLLLQFQFSELPMVLI